MADVSLPLLLLALAPGVFWLVYFYSRDRYEPEPLSWVLTVYLLGMAVTMPVAILEGGLELATGSFISAILVAPVVEELAKYLVVRKTVYESQEFDEPVDGIVYAAAAGLGFATLENVIYVFSSYQESLVLALETGLLRGVLSVPGHVLFSAMWGYALGQARFLPVRRGKAVIFQGLLIAMAAHALFNFLLISDLGFAILALVVVPALWIAVHRRIRTSLEESSFRQYR